MYMTIASLTMIAAATGVSLIDSLKTEWYIEFPLIISLGVIGTVVLSYSLKRMTKRREDRMKIKGNGRSRQVWLNGEFLSPFPSQQVVNHSPDGFSWGYRGSGPAQLALAILLKICPKEKALREYQKFKDVKIAALPVDEDFEIEIDETTLF